MIQFSHIYKSRPSILLNLQAFNGVLEPIQGYIMAVSESTAAERVTFGVELEILVPYLWSHQADPAGDTDKRQLIRLSQEDMGSGEVFLTAHDQVKNILRAFLRSHGIAVSNNDVQEPGPPREYSIGYDSSIREFGFQQYHFTGVELRSPALFAEPTSFNEVKRVVSLLISNFRLRINETTGFHVHVGTGSDRLPPRAVRRLSQFLWCADGFLSQVHPPERMLSHHCPSIRHWCHLAEGDFDNWRFAEKELEELWQFLGLSSPPNPAEDQEDHTEVSRRLAPLQTNGASFHALDSRTESLRPQRLPSVRTNPYQDEGARGRYYSSKRVELQRLTRRQFLQRGPSQPRQVGLPALEPTDRCTSIIDGLRTLCQPEMYENPTRAVNLLQGYNSQRFNYNLTAYDFVAGDLLMRTTVEFREATGSLNPTWIAAWAKICSRIVEFCLEAEENVFADVLQRLLEAELAFEANGQDSRLYDVIDLLNDLGLRNEARFVEEKILLGDKNVFWFPCALEENSPVDHSNAPIMVPSDDVG